MNSKDTSITAQDLTAVELPPTTVETDISLTEASQGTCRILSVKDPVLCPDCVNIKANNGKKCAKCAGLGYVHEYRQVEVSLPAGMLAGQEISYPGLGRYNLCAQRNSDLIVKIKICRHPYLELAGKNISCTLVVSIMEAILGRKISVPTVSGKKIIKLHPLTTSGQTYRLKGLGLAGGDQFISIEVSPWQKPSNAKADANSCHGGGTVNDPNQQSLSLSNLKSAVAG